MFGKCKCCFCTIGVITVIFGIWYLCCGKEKFMKSESMLKEDMKCVCNDMKKVGESVAKTVCDTKESIMEAVPGMDGQQ